MCNHHLWGQSAEAPKHATTQSIHVCSHDLWVRATDAPQHATIPSRLKNIELGPNRRMETVHVDSVPLRVEAAEAAEHISPFQQVVTVAPFHSSYYTNRMPQRTSKNHAVRRIRYTSLPSGRNSSASNSSWHAEPTSLFDIACPSEHIQGNGNKWHK